MTSANSTINAPTPSNATIATAAPRAPTRPQSGMRCDHSGGSPQTRSTPMTAPMPAISAPPSIAAHGAAATSVARGSSALPSTATAACAPAIDARTGPASIRNRPPSLRADHRAPSCAIPTTATVGSSGSTLSGWPPSASGIWCAASHSGIAAANALSTDRPPPALSTITPTAGTSTA